LRGEVSTQLDALPTSSNGDQIVKDLQSATDGLVRVIELLGQAREVQVKFPGEMS
jgi:hypothetical protein